MLLALLAASPSLVDDRLVYWFVYPWQSVLATGCQDGKVRVFNYKLAQPEVYTLVGHSARAFNWCGELMRHILNIFRCFLVFSGLAFSCAVLLWRMHLP